MISLRFSFLFLVSLLHHQSSSRHVSVSFSLICVLSSLSLYFFFTTSSKLEQNRECFFLSYTMVSLYFCFLFSWFIRYIIKAWVETWVVLSLLYVYSPLFFFVAFLLRHQTSSRNASVSFSLIYIHSLLFLFISFLLAFSLSFSEIVNI